MATLPLTRRAIPAFAAPNQQLDVQAEPIVKDMNTIKEVFVKVKYMSKMHVVKCAPI